jgi:16S rRNA (cytidine1402-2'-O)-methyltransferase
MKQNKHKPAGKLPVMSALPAGLYPVAVPIGNPDDITLRAIDTLRLCDAVICEEHKNGIRLLKSMGLDKPIYLLNEHSKPVNVKLLFEDLLIRQDKAIALISDAGTPGFADPGAELVRLCHEFRIPVYSVPGASSIMAALMASGMKADKFLYYGFLSAKREERISELKVLKPMNRWDIIFLEAPYRLQSLLADMQSVLGKTRNAMLFFQLTQPTEKILSGNLEELCRLAESLPKGEFVLILEHLF